MRSRFRCARASAVRRARSRGRGLFMIVAPSRNVRIRFMDRQSCGPAMPDRRREQNRGSNRPTFDWRPPEDPMLTVDDIALVRASFARVLPNKDIAADLFYHRLFELAPH